MNHNYTLSPRDLLFMRDGRPMGGADAGCGASWPRPDHLWRALMAALWRTWPERQSWESYKANAIRFTTLSTIGPFPIKKTRNNEEMLYFPCPQDVALDIVEASGAKSGVLRSMALVSGGQTNLPSPLKYSLESPVYGKNAPPLWLSLENYQRYLKNEPIQLSAGELSPELLYVSERAIGVGIDSKTRAAKKSILYQAEYLRLMPGVSMAFDASCIDSHAENSDVDVLGKLELPTDLIMGGQQGVATLEETQKPLRLPNLENPVFPAQGSVVLRWTLLTPMLNITGGDSRMRHPAGWLPTWVDADDGAVKLPGERRTVPRRPGMSREAWRRECMGASLERAKLVAARIGKPVAFAGWNLKENCPKHTRLAVPAGSAYYFQCPDGETARQLWGALNAVGKDGTRIRKLSSQYGEAGFGVGVCSIVSASI